MKKSVSITDFMDAFTKMRPSNFTYEGLECLYNYLIDFERDTNTEIELDVIALCCDYSEYKNLDEFLYLNPIGLLLKTININQAPQFAWRLFFFP